MKRTKLQKFLAVAMMATMIMGSTIGANAAPSSNPSSNPVSVVPSSPASSASQAAAAAVEQATSSPTSKVTVGGEEIVTTVKGSYSAKTVPGIAVVAPATNIAAAYGLNKNQTLYAIVMDTDQKKSNKAMASLNAAAQALNAKMGPVLNIDLGYRENNMYHLLPIDGADIMMTVAIPAEFQDAAAQYAVICVRYGGAITILPDLDLNAETITFNTTGGLGCYALVKY